MNTTSSPQNASAADTWLPYLQNFLVHAVKQHLEPPEPFHLYNELIKKIPADKVREYWKTFEPSLRVSIQSFFHTQNCTGKELEAAFAGTGKEHENFLEDAVHDQVNVIRALHQFLQDEKVKSTPMSLYAASYLMRANILLRTTRRIQSAPADKRKEAIRQYYTILLQEALRELDPQEDCKKVLQQLVPLFVMMERLQRMPQDKPMGNLRPVQVELQKAVDALWKAEKDIQAEKRTVTPLLVTARIMLNDTLQLFLQPFGQQSLRNALNLAIPDFGQFPLLKAPVPFVKENFPSFLLLANYCKDLRQAIWDDTEKGLEFEKTNFLLEQLEKTRQNLHASLRKEIKIFNALMEYEGSKSPTEDARSKIEKFSPELPAIYQKATESYPDLKKAMQNFHRLECCRSLEMFLTPRYHRLEFFKSRLWHLTENIQAGKGRERLTGPNLVRIIEQRLSYSTLIDSALNDAPQQYVDLRCTDCRLALPPTAIGKGRSSVVRFCRYKTDENTVVERAFKQEYAAAVGNNALNLGRSAEEPSGQIGMKNIAAYEAAKLLHCEELIVKTTLGMLQGEYGYFMEIAPGYRTCDLASHDQKALQAAPPYPGCLSILEIQNLPEEKKQDVRGQLMSKFNRIQWMDLLSAQGDRHRLNYRLAVDKNYRTTVKCLDNDACFFSWRIGLTKIRMDGDHYTYLPTVVQRHFADKFDIPTFFKGFAPDVVLEPGPQTCIIDFSKMTLMQLQVLQRCTGQQSFKIPDLMDEGIYQALLELEQHPERLRETLSSFLTQKEMQATENRLKEMIALAKQYQKQGKIVPAEKWQDPKFQHEMDDNYRRTILKQGQDGVNYRNFRFHTDMFYRDFAWLFVSGESYVAYQEDNDNEAPVIGLSPADPPSEAAPDLSLDWKA